MAITRYTTPPIGLLVKGFDITQKDVYVTVEQCDVQITLTGEQLTMTATETGDTQITFALSQEEAGSLSIKAPAEIQVNWMDDGTRKATQIAKVRVFENLLDEVIE